MENTWKPLLQNHRFLQRCFHRFPVVNAHGPDLALGGHHHNLRTYLAELGHQRRLQKKVIHDEITSDS